MPANTGQTHKPFKGYTQQQQATARYTEAPLRGTVMPSGGGADYDADDMGRDYDSGSAHGGGITTPRMNGQYGSRRKPNGKSGGKSGKRMKGGKGY